MNVLSGNWVLDGLTLFTLIMFIGLSIWGLGWTILFDIAKKREDNCAMERAVNKVKTIGTYNIVSFIVFVLLICLQITYRLTNPQ